MTPKTVPSTLPKATKPKRGGGIPSQLAAGPKDLSKLPPGLKAYWTKKRGEKK